MRDLTRIHVSYLPFCDFCRVHGANVFAHYDAATTIGPWANLCEKHFQQYGRGLGTGKGQRLILVQAETGK